MMPVMTQPMSNKKIMSQEGVQNRARPWDMKYPIVQTNVKTGAKADEDKEGGKRKLKKK